MCIDYEYKLTFFKTLNVEALKYFYIQTASFHYLMGYGSTAIINYNSFSEKIRPVSKS